MFFIIDFKKTKALAAKSERFYLTSCIEYGKIVTNNLWNGRGHNNNVFSIVGVSNERDMN